MHIQSIDILQGTEWNLNLIYVFLCVCLCEYVCVYEVSLCFFVSQCWLCMFLCFCLYRDLGFWPCVNRRETNVLWSDFVWTHHKLSENLVKLRPKYKSNGCYFGDKVVLAISFTYGIWRINWGRLPLEHKLRSSSIYKINILAYSL
jgi:hypothetical protein